MESFCLDTQGKKDSLSPTLARLPHDDPSPFSKCLRQHAWTFMFSERHKSSTFVTGAKPCWPLYRYRTSHRTTDEIVSICQNM